MIRSTVLSLIFLGSVLFTFIALFNDKLLPYAVFGGCAIVIFALLYLVVRGSKTTLFALDLKREKEIAQLEEWYNK